MAILSTQCLSSGQSLQPGQSLKSNNGLHTLVMQQDGNVVLYDRNSQPLWSTKTGGLITPREFAMQTDGNLVLYSTDDVARWVSNTWGNPGAFLDVQDDGNIVVYRAGSQSETADNALWAAASNDPQNLIGGWAPLNNQPGFAVGTMLLLTDGSVMCQQAGAAQWFLLTPDSSGGYSSGAWSQLADGPNAPLYFASAVLRDGRVFAAGGEYNNGQQAELLAAEIYNPETNRWQALNTPQGWDHIGDAPSCVLPDGRILLGSITDGRCTIFDPVSNNWSVAASKQNGDSGEETWTLLPDGTIMTADAFGAPQTEKYVIALDRWIPSGPTPASLVESASYEIGPAVLLPDGRLFAIGATGETALYMRPQTPQEPGSWTRGPRFPQVNGGQLGAKDAPACLMPNGRVLCAVGPVDGVSGDYLPPTYFYEFDPATNALTRASDPPTNGGPPFAGCMLLLPTGQVMFANQSNNVQIYTPNGSPDASWTPSITELAPTVKRGTTQTLRGRQINGLSQAVSYGDDAQMATNYPIVQLRNITTNVTTYCKTFNHSTMGIATGAEIHSTQFIAPVGAPAGASQLRVIANGIPSESLSVSVE